MTIAKRFKYPKGVLLSMNIDISNHALNGDEIMVDEL